MTTTVSFKNWTRFRGLQMYSGIKLFFCVLLATLVLTSHGRAQVVEDDAQIVALGGPTRDYQLGLEKTTGGESIYEFTFFVDDLGNDQFQFSAGGIAELFALFFAMPGDRIVPDFVGSNVPFASNYSDFFSPEPDEILTLDFGESVFFGYWDDRGFEFADANDNYGWFELHRSGRFDASLGQLEILGGATAIGRGIVVGTTNTIVIPEPSAAVLFSLINAFVLVRRRRR